MLAWWMLVPTLLAMMVALVLPVFMWLRAGGRSSLVAVAAAPAFTFGLVTIMSVAYPLLDIEWESSTALPILGLSNARFWFDADPSAFGREALEMQRRQLAQLDPRLLGDAGIGFAERQAELDKPCWRD